MDIRLTRPIESDWFFSGGAALATEIPAADLQRLHAAASEYYGEHNNYPFCQAWRSS